MSDEARSLYRKNEIVRRLRGPFREAFRPLQRIKCAVDFDRVESIGGMSQLPVLRQLLWIEFSAPRRIRPSGNSDTYRSQVWHLFHSTFKISDPARYTTATDQVMIFAIFLRSATNRFISSSRSASVGARKIAEG